MKRAELNRRFGLVLAAAYDQHVNILTEMNRAAQALGRLAKGKPKHYTAAELKRRKERLAEARKNRWPKK